MHITLMRLSSKWKVWKRYSRIEMEGNLRGNNCALFIEDDNTLNLVKRGRMEDLYLFNTLLQKSRGILD